MAKVCNRSNPEKTGRSCEGADFGWLSLKVSRTLMIGGVWSILLQPCIALHFNHLGASPYESIEISERHSLSTHSTYFNCMVTFALTPAIDSPWAWCEMVFALETWNPWIGLHNIGQATKVLLMWWSLTLTWFQHVIFIVFFLFFIRDDMKSSSKSFQVVLRGCQKEWTCKTTNYTIYPKTRL